MAFLGCRSLSLVPRIHSRWQASILRHRQVSSLHVHSLSSEGSAFQSDSELKSWDPPPSISEIIPSTWTKHFDLELPEGECVGLQCAEEHTVATPSSANLWMNNLDSNHWIHSCLHPEEIEWARRLGSSRSRMSFFLGRLAMRELVRTEKPLLKDNYGRPTMPPEYIGSISHKGSIGVALVSKSPPQGVKRGIGIDIEQTFSAYRRRVATKILTEREIQDLGKVENVTEMEEVMLRFSLKEALYKAVHPLVCEYVAFQEAEVTPHSDGTASLKWLLKTGTFDKEILDYTAHWKRVDNHFLTSGSVTLR